MSIVLNFLTSARASGYHAADALESGGTLVDGDVASTLQPASTGLSEAAGSLGVSVSALFSHLVPLSAELIGNRELAQRVVHKVAGRSAPAVWIDLLLIALREMEDAFKRAVPGVAEELPLRVEPLKSLWEARGPGLLSALVERTEPDLLVSEARVLLVHPACGGGGKAHPAYNLVRIEALLANPLPELPEVLRLGWLLAQLNLDLPAYQGNLHRDRAVYLGAVGLIPAVLSAGEMVELCRPDSATIESALAHWITGLAVTPELTAGLADWWHVMCDTSTPWPVAIAALDQLVP
jgi:hypothetical protein